MESRDVDKLIKVCILGGLGRHHFLANSISQIGLLDLTPPIRSAFYSASGTGTGN
jgi:hypothetical protein